MFRILKFRLPVSQAAMVIRKEIAKEAMKALPKIRMIPSLPFIHQRAMRVNLILQVHSTLRTPLRIIRWAMPQVRRETLEATTVRSQSNRKLEIKNLPLRPTTLYSS